MGRVDPVEDLGDARAAEQNAEGRLVVVTALVQRPQPRGDARDRDASLPLRRVQAAAVDDKLSPCDVDRSAVCRSILQRWLQALVERVHCAWRRSASALFCRRRS
jgi:hypothetical protein